MKNQFNKAKLDAMEYDSLDGGSYSIVNGDHIYFLCRSCHKEMQTVSCTCDKRADGQVFITLFCRRCQTVTGFKWNKIPERTHVFSLAIIINEIKALCGR